MLTVRLQRIGKTKHPAYRFIVSEKSKDTQAGGIEILGSYNPVARPKQCLIKKERVLYWLSKGAQTSATAHNILVRQGIISGPKKKKVTISKKRKAKLESEKK